MAYISHRLQPITPNRILKRTYLKAVKNEQWYSNWGGKSDQGCSWRTINMGMSFPVWFPPLSPFNSKVAPVIKL